MRERQIERHPRHPRDFEAFVAGAGGRLLHVATLLTAEHPGHAPAAEDVLVTALSRTYARWDRMRGEDPYDHTRRELAEHIARHVWRFRRPRGGLLGRLPPQERLVLVLRSYEGVAVEQVAAVLGLTGERVETLYSHAVATMRSRPAVAAGRRLEGAR
ncbi:sigma factor-like helix-turn-helix DNA-binding protein [Streptomyces oceani]|uniref:RNA polymerase sigma-70 region 4 domain-containing protein n=1 Tax=Streptomyces oceani TaxID=1075402 RepID=A0A1E7KIF7_9ACTN|nr:sigma factor-like helix-turn-helix DNA-binding protein [Streptomyces oceani]OEV03685.1 hypothetical protein AN216_10560 [Streptomyces oceani]